MVNYLYISIILVCFYDALITMLIPSSAMFVLAEDGQAGLMISVLIALFIGLFALINCGFKRLPNVWVAFLMLFIAFSSFHGPNIVFDGAFTPKDVGLVNYKPMFEACVYFLMFLGIYSLHLSRESKFRINHTFAWIGILYSAYIVFQHCGMDQLYHLVGTPISGLSRNPTDGGFISQPVFAAAVLSICLPFVCKYKSLWFGLLVCTAIFLTGNRSAIIATICSMTLLFTSNKKAVLIMIVSYICLLALAVCIYWVHPNFNFHICDSGRLLTWKQVISDILHPMFPGIHKSYILTGLGLGSFSLLFPFHHHSCFYQAHNEYLEVLYTLSIVGVFLFFKMQQHIFMTVRDNCLASALVAISVFAITNPVWHVPQLQFLTVMLISLAYNKEFTHDLGEISRT